MSNTYRSVSRDHRAKVAVALTSASRTTPGGKALQCEFSPACNSAAVVTITARGVPPLYWPTVCESHAAAYR